MPEQPFAATILLPSEHTNGAVSAVALDVPASWSGPPLHHHAFDEAFYVLAGRLTFQLGEELVSAGPNTLVFAPGDSVHAVANLDSTAARYLLLCAPGGFERRFEPDAAGAIPATTVVGDAIARHRGPASRPLPPVGRGINVLVRGEDGTGRIAVMDNSVGASFAGPPLHHHDFDELFYVVEGALTFQIGDAVVTRRAGQLAFAPRGVHHTWANHSDAPARTLIVCTPAGFRALLRRDGRPAGGRRAARVGPATRSAHHRRRSADPSRHVCAMTSAGLNPDASMALRSGGGSLFAVLAFVAVGSSVAAAEELASYPDRRRPRAALLRRRGAAASDRPLPPAATVSA